MHDVLPSDMARWHFVERTYRELVERYGYEEIRTPILEPLELFVRGIGETTDIVEKEMYAFEDKGGDRLALRPEGTASVIRAYVQHSLQVSEPLSKCYYLGPMFRRERPAKGRYRQFYQAGAELVGAEEPAADAEIIDMAVRFVERLGLDRVRVHLNSLGESGRRPIFRDALVAIISAGGGCAVLGLPATSRDQPAADLGLQGRDVPESGGNRPRCSTTCRLRGPSTSSRFGGCSTATETPYDVDPTIVRGLDYYTRTIFEIQGEADTLGAQATIVGGGRYNTLVSELGGRRTPAIGFSFGIKERVLLMMIDDGRSRRRRPLVYVAGVGHGGIDRAELVAR